jgi:predicted permease
MQMLWQDLRYALRMLLKSPSFTFIAVLTLALGIGANTAMFSVIDAVVLAPLPYVNPDRLVMVWENNPHFPRTWVSYPNFRDWQRDSRSFEQMAAIREKGVDATGSGASAHLNGREISSGLFNMLGTKLILGREFSPQEDRFGGTPVVVISDRLWSNRFDRSPEVLGRLLTLDGRDYTIVGVSPFGITALYLPREDDADVYMPLGQGDPLTLGDRAAHSGIYALARLAPQVTLKQAQAEISAIQNGLDQLYPDANRDLGTYIEPLKQFVVADTGKMLLLLLGAVGFVLLIACANVAGLLIARSATRMREFAVRSALGASRVRLVRQLLTESVLLSLFGACLGCFVATLGVKLILARVSGDLPRTENIGLNSSVLMFTLGSSIAVGILFGLAPLLKIWNSDPQGFLKEGGRGSTTVHHRAQSGLVVVQIALTLVLLVGAGLLFRTMRRLWEVNPGFETQRVVAFKVGVSHAHTKTASGTRIAYQQLIDRIRQVPGVEAADFTSSVPLGDGVWTLPFWIGSQKPTSLQGAPRLVMFLTGPDYFRTMGIPLIRGRFFTENDTTNSPCVMIIDSFFARKYFNDADPLTQTLSAGFSPMGPCRIVGVVGHIRDASLQDDNTLPQVQAYLPLYQDPDKWVPVNYPDAKIVVRTSLATAVVMPSIKEIVYAGGDDQPLYDIHPIKEIISESMSPQRFLMILLGAFAGLALLMAGVGIYGMISYSVTQRVHEIGIRMALGASKRDILTMVVGQGVTMACAGLVVGVVGSLVLARLLSSFTQLLYGVGAHDPLTLISISAGLILLVVMACYMPARRAMKVDPMVALRYE